MSDETDQLRQRLLALLEQVERDRASLKRTEQAGLTAYSHLFDSLTSTLHNLNRPAEVEKPR